MLPLTKHLTLNILPSTDFNPPKPSPLPSESPDYYPSLISDKYWLSCYSNDIDLNDISSLRSNGGKWLIFVNVTSLDTLWRIIKDATESGLLGPSSKCST